MTDGFLSFFKGFYGSFHPRMLLLTLLPLGLAIGGWGVFSFFFLDVLFQWMHQWLYGSGVAPDVVNVLQGISGPWIKTLLVPFLVFVLLWPFVASTSVVIASMVVMPFVVDHVEKKAFPGLERRGNASVWRSVAVGLKATFVYLLGWIVTLPLWLIPGVGLVLPFFWTAYLLVKVMRFDALATHASEDEFNALGAADQMSAWAIGILCAVLSVVPPVLLLMPVVSALAFTHLYLGRLRALRARNEGSDGKTLEAQF